MLTAFQIIGEALRISKASVHEGMALNLLNNILSNLCQTRGFARARATYQFNFNPGLLTSYGSGPYPLPLDYLRTSDTSGSTGISKSVFWTLLGVPYFMMPCDLAEFDMQVQQAGLQSYPWLYVTDMSVANIELITTAQTVAGSPYITPAPGTDFSRLRVGQSVSGENIAPGSVTTFIPVWGEFNWGAGNWGQITLSLPATGTSIQAVGTSVPPSSMSVGVVGSSVFFGRPPVAYVYPPPSGAYPVTDRYQRQMPLLVDLEAYPWFPDDRYLIEALTGELMKIPGDPRTVEYLGDGMRPGRADRRLAEYLRLTDDKTNRAQTVQLDPRRFGRRFQHLRNTKTVGW